MGGGWVGNQDDIATYQSQTGTFYYGEDGAGGEVRDGLDKGSFVLAPDNNVHRGITGALFQPGKEKFKKIKIKKGEIKINVIAFHDSLRCRVLLSVV